MIDNDSEKSTILGGKPFGSKFCDASFEKLAQSKILPAIFFAWIRYLGLRHFLALKQTNLGNSSVSTG